MFQHNGEDLSEKINTFCAHLRHTPAHACCFNAASASTSRTARLMFLCALNDSRFWYRWPFFTGSDITTVEREVEANGGGAVFCQKECWRAQRSFGFALRSVFLRFISDSSPPLSPFLAGAASRSHSTFAEIRQDGA
jgi:hypothetical protein|tara:strand:- start:1303 stop:1713 length:411 start_codon:yes stop_codon:yes gene_type:complete